MQRGPIQMRSRRGRTGQPRKQDQEEAKPPTQEEEHLHERLYPHRRPRLRLPEYLALAAGLKDVDPNSPDAQEINSILEELDESCGD